MKKNFQNNCIAFKSSHIESFHSQKAVKTPEETKSASRHDDAQSRTEKNAIKASESPNRAVNLIMPITSIKVAELRSGFEGLELH